MDGGWAGGDMPPASDGGKAPRAHPTRSLHWGKGTGHNASSVGESGVSDEERRRTLPTASSVGESREIQRRRSVYRDKELCREPYRRWGGAAGPCQSDPKPDGTVEGESGFRASCHRRGGLPVLGCLPKKNH